MTTNKPPIPITVFTGFLGAGKTSVILSLLPKLPRDYKAVLLKNEFGDIEGAPSEESKKIPMTNIGYSQWTASLQTSQIWLELAKFSMVACKSEH